MITFIDSYNILSIIVVIKNKYDFFTILRRLKLFDRNRNEMEIKDAYRHNENIIILFLLKIKILFFLLKKI